ncbi:MAG: AAA family ATPase [Candidatus Rokubacteria bacterium]|nr:AAA family ATPase [Chloroflexota bacterium]MBM4441476.1 AAA family ATPase [Candidatus Rokubacteria bacterium]
MIGNTGSGKSTLAAELARRLGVPFVELDALHWEPNWVEAPAETLRARVCDATSGDGWVVAGNYLTKTQDLTWTRAETVVYLDYPLLVTLGRLVRRTLERWRRRELLWGTNRERIHRHLMLWNPNESLIALAVVQHRRRERFATQIRDPRWSHIRFVRLRSPRATAAWLATAAPVESERAR